MSLGADVGIFAISIAAGLIGALAGVGGGILIVPTLTLLFGIDIRLAIGASIVSVIATSSGAAAAYVRDRMTDMRVGMFLELATTTGAVVGALLAAIVAQAFLYILLGVVLLGSALMQVLRLGEEMPPEVEPGWPPVSASRRATRMPGSAARSPTPRGACPWDSSSCGALASCPGSSGSARAP